MPLFNQHFSSLLRDYLFKKIKKNINYFIYSKLILLFSLKKFDIRMVKNDFKRFTDVDWLCCKLILSSFFLFEQYCIFSTIKS